MLKNLYKAIKSLIGGVIFLFIAGLFLTSLLNVKTLSDLEESIENIPNYNYIQDIIELKKEGKLSEALEITRYVIRYPDMPGQEGARRLEIELENELTSLWGRTKRAMKGFVLGSGSSIEELSGGIASDMIVYGDIRDLLKQGYFKITSQETDGVVAALAGIGLLTEVIDIADWVPAVLKAFRKIGALTKQFSNFVISACRKSAKVLKLDVALKLALKNLGVLVEKMGLARTAAMFKHINTPADLSVITKTADKSVDAAYFTVKNGGAEGINILKYFDAADDGISIMKKAAKKGPGGVAWLSKRTRITVRTLKNLRLERPQKLISELARQSPKINGVFWLITIISALFAFIGFVKAGRLFYKVISIEKNKGYH